MAEDFVHLHLHSEYSILDGAIKFPELMEKLRALGMKAVALTDHGNLFGAIEFYKYARDYGIKPIIGMEAYVTAGDMRERDNADKNYHLTLLALNEKGYRNLLFLSSKAYLEGFYYKPRIDKKLLAEHSEGLVALSGCLKGEIPHKYLMEDEEAALEAAYDYIDIFGKENFYLELQELGLEENPKVNTFLLDLAKRLELKVVATNDVHYLNPEDYRAHDVLLCIQTGKKLNDDRRLRFKTREVYLKSQEAMAALFKDVPEAIRNTLEIAERVDLRLDLDPKKVHLPRFDLPPGYESADKYLRDLALEGLRNKMGEIPQEYAERLDRELEIIGQMGYSGYFLIIRDIVSKARELGVPVGPGRGSAVGSLVLYALDVTEIDPIQYNLFFERFLNPERVSPPDVDIDFGDIGRDSVIEYVRKKYGENNVTQIITFGRMLARAAIRDVGRVLDIPYSEVDRIAKMIPQRPNITLEEALAESKELQNLIESREDYREMFEIARRIQGLVRNTSTHAAGVVIAPSEIWNYSPLYRNSDGSVSTQYDMKSVEELGLLKVDFLGLRTLTILRWAEEEIRRRKDPNFELKNIPLNDKATYRLLSRGDTLGVFQLESKGFQDLLRKLKPSRFNDIIAALALYRPGPIESGMIPPFIARKHNREKTRYPLKQLEKILKETYGVIVYQEQVMQIAAEIAGFSLGQADLLRRAMGKKKAHVMQEQKKAFVEGAAKRGIKREIAEKIFDDISPFARYGFNKSHATGYALLSYRTAYLKAHYPAEFMMANLSAEMNTQNFQDKISALIKECRRLKIKVMPPDINRSYYRFTLQDDSTIVYGLGAIKNVGESAVEEIVSKREEGGPYKSLSDFLSRVDTRRVNKKVVESLVKAGAFDSFEENRAKLLKDVSLYYSGKGLSANQISLFGGETTREEKEEITWNLQTKLSFEKEALGFFLSGHPLDRYKQAVPYLNVTGSTELREMENGESVRLVGTLVKLARKKDRQGKPYAQPVFEDYQGEFQTIIFSSLFQEKASLLVKDGCYLMEGRVSKDDETGEVKVIINSIESLDEYRDLRPQSLVIRVETSFQDTDLADRLWEILKDYRGDIPLYFEVKTDKGTFKMKSRNFAVMPDIRLLEKLKKALGPRSVKLVMSNGKNKAGIAGESKV